MSPALIWFLVGLALVFLEFAVPGVILVFFGFGAWVTSITTAIGLTKEISSQSAVFAISSLLLLFGLRRFLKSWFTGFDERGNPSTNMDEFLNKPVKVTQAITAGSTGKVEFKGASWNARSESNLQPGANAIIIGRDGLCLIVIPQ